MKHTYQTSLLALFLLTQFTSAQQSQPFFEDREVLVARDSIAAYSIPFLAVTPKGTILCFSTTRIWDNGDWGNIQQAALIRSTDNGETWLPPQIVAGKDNWMVRSDWVMVDPESGRILMCGYKSPLMTPAGIRISETWSMENPEKMAEMGSGWYMIESKDDGKTWSEMRSVEMQYHGMGNGIELQRGEHKGRFVVSARTQTRDVFDWNYMFNSVLYSDDRGKTWQAGGLTQSHVGECVIAELSDGRLYVNNRNHAENFGIRNHAISSDGGETFTEFGDDPQLIEPTCHAGLASFTSNHNERVFIFSNPAVRASKRWDSAARHSMSVRASFDDCQTWPLKKLVYAGPTAYSALAVGHDNTIFLVYERAGLGNRDSRENLSIARFNLAWLRQPEVSAPQITPPGSTFYGSQTIEIIAHGKEHIRFTLDGSEPTISSSLYQTALHLEEGAIVKAKSFSEDDQLSSITTAALFRQSILPAPDYLISYDERYPASGDFSLVDNQHGSLNFRDNRWQGFEAVDLDVVLDLDTMRTISEVSIGFLQETTNWIFLPDSVSLETSAGGESYTHHASMLNRGNQPQPIQFRDDLSFKVQTVARYVRIHASNIDVCPDWHPYAGEKAWLFVDEITIR